MAALLVDFFMDHLWPDSRTDADADDPAAWAELTHALDRLRPLATTSVISLLDLALAHAAERAAERKLGDDAAGPGVGPPVDPGT
jgi:hypothetical protein